MKKKTELIDISKISLYLDLISTNQDKSQKDSARSEPEIDFDRQSIRSYDTYSTISKQTDAFQQRQEYVINNRDIKGLHLRRVRADDKVSLKLIYLLDPKYNSGFLILSEKNMMLSEILEGQNEMKDIKMKQK